jgi:hypothetical protein
VLLAIYLVIKMCEHSESAPRAPPRNPPQPPSATHNRVVNLSEVVSEVSYNISTNIPFSQIECAICLEGNINNETIYKLRCGHTYHTVLSWFLGVKH